MGCVHSRARSPTTQDGTCLAAACQDAAPPGFADQFIVNWRSKLGQGAFSRVYECVEISTGTTFAVKIVDLARWKLLRTFSLARVLREAQVLSGLDHPHIVKMQAVFQAPSALWMVQELAPGSELFQVIVRGGPVPEASAAGVGFVTAQRNPPPHPRTCPSLWQRNLSTTKHPRPSPPPPLSPASSTHVCSASLKVSFWVCTV